VAAPLPFAHAQAPRQTPAPRPPITLAVDAREVSRRILHVRETIPVQAGALTLLYPEWIPGEHGPTGPVTDVAGLRITAQDRALVWRRDLENMYAIRITVPAGVSALDVSFDFILPPQGARFSSGASSSANLLLLSWNQVILYPSTPRPDDIAVSPSLTLPEGWQYATALRAQGPAGGSLVFAPVSLTTLVDSPVQTGIHMRRVDLTPASGVPHFLDLAADDEAALAIPADLAAAYRNLVVEANALFGAHHYDHFDFLFTLSDQVAHFGLEHHQSNDDRVAERSLIDPNYRPTSFSALLPHEFVHSWNGKHRRPAGLATGDFSSPMHGDLLWVYEGLTQYLGDILAARSGLWTPANYREDLALKAATLDLRPGRGWRPLQDVNDEAQLLYNARRDWDTWRRNVDFYDEGALIWLEADVIIRGLTNGRKSLDDFCRAFHGGLSGSPSMVPYTYEDVVRALNAVAAYDWDGFFATRIRNVAPRAPMGGIEGSGWRLVFSDTPTTLAAALEANSGTLNLLFSLGLIIGQDGSILDVAPGTPAATAGVGPGMTLVAVNGRRYTADILRDALRLGRTATTPLELLVTNGEFYRDYAVDYHGGERYPSLERDPSRPDLLGTIITPLASAR
jgi:predicted metalloprotease with PDZ domain